MIVKKERGSVKTLRERILLERRKEVLHWREGYKRKMNRHRTSNRGGGELKKGKGKGERLERVKKRGWEFLRGGSFQAREV